MINTFILTNVSNIISFDFHARYFFQQFLPDFQKLNYS